MIHFLAFRLYVYLVGSFAGVFFVTVLDDFGAVFVTVFFVVTVADAFFVGAFLVVGFLAAFVILFGACLVTLAGFFFVSFFLGCFLGLTFLIGFDGEEGILGLIVI